MRIVLNVIFILFQDSRITVQCENSTECYLYIAEVRETDSGLYQCQANTPPGSWETRYTSQYTTRQLGNQVYKPIHHQAAGKPGIQANTPPGSWETRYTSQYTTRQLGSQVYKNIEGFIKGLLTIRKEGQ